MKKHILNVAILATMVVVGCTNSLPEALPQVNNSERVITESPYNEAFDGVAQTVSKAMVLSSDFRQVVKELSLQKFDGDYDIMLSTLGEQTVSDYASTKGLTGPITVAQMFDELFPANTKTLTPEEILATLAEMYPLMQISVPVHAEDWEPGYIPTVVFLDDNYVDTVTEYVKGYNSAGEEVWVDAINEPEVPIIVISENERFYSSNINNKSLVGSQNLTAPTNLTAAIEGLFINLTWELNSTGGWKSLVYYSIDGSSFISDGIIPLSTTYRFGPVAPGKTYSFYVKTMNNMGQSSPSSQIVTVTTATHNILPLSSFSAQIINDVQVYLTWDQNTTSSNDYIHIYRRKLADSSITDLGTLIATISNPNIHHYYDSFSDGGERYLYTAINAKDGCSSNYKQDVVWKTFRNISTPDTVCIKSMSYDVSKISDIEGWLKGAPEFRVASHTIAGETAKVTTRTSGKFFEFSSRSTSCQTFNSNNLLFKWLPETTYDCLSIYVAEYDQEDIDKEISYSYSAAAGIKFNDNINLSLNGTVTVDKGNGDISLGAGETYYFMHPTTTIPLENAEFMVSISNTNKN